MKTRWEINIKISVCLTYPLPFFALQFSAFKLTVDVINVMVYVFCFYLFDYYYTFPYGLKLPLYE